MSHKKSLFFSLTPLLLLLPLICCGIRLHKTLPDSLSVARGSVCSINVGRFVFASLPDFCTKAAASAAQGSFAAEDDGNLTLYTEVSGKYDVELKFLGVLPLKTMSVDVLDSDVVIPSGDAVGIKIHTDGVLVVKLASAETENGEIHTPAKDAGLQVGDIITAVDGTKVKNSDHFSALADEKGKQGFTLDFVRGTEKISTRMQPVYSGGHYKIGAWIRDSTAGIGTMTFIKPDSGVFASLGHGISDADTGSLLTVSDGSVTNCRISSVSPGTKGSPGELHGVFADNDNGVIMQNSNVGIYGKCGTNSFACASTVKIASRFEVKTGSAKILSTVDSQGPAEYDIEIEKVMTNSSDAKGMIIRVTDERLLGKTGGIVQGMSGSPILQNGKIVGAVTHVFINDPTRGYGIFIELMIDEAQKAGAQ